MEQGDVLRVNRPVLLATLPGLDVSNAGRDVLESYMSMEDAIEAFDEVMIGSRCNPPLAALDRSNGAKTKGNFSFGQGQVVASHLMRSLFDSPTLRKMPSESHTSLNHREEA